MQRIKWNTMRFPYRRYHCWRYPYHYLHAYIYNIWMLRILQFLYDIEFIKIFIRLTWKFRLIYCLILLVAVLGICSTVVYWLRERFLMQQIVQLIFRRIAAFLSRLKPVYVCIKAYETLQVILHNQILIVNQYTYMQFSN